MGFSQSTTDDAIVVTTTPTAKKNDPSKVVHKPVQGSSETNRKSTNSIPAPPEERKIRLQKTNQQWEVPYVLFGDLPLAKFRDVRALQGLSWVERKITEANWRLVPFLNLTPKMSYFRINGDRQIVRDILLDLERLIREHSQTVDETTAKKCYDYVKHLRSHLPNRFLGKSSFPTPSQHVLEFSAELTFRFRSFYSKCENMYRYAMFECWRAACKLIDASNVTKKTPKTDLGLHQSPARRHKIEIYVNPQLVFKRWIQFYTMVIQAK